MWLATLALLFQAAAVDSPIKSDEDVVFFPTYAWAEQGTVHLPVHGWIHEPETNSFFRQRTLDLFRRSLGISKKDAASDLFKQRAAYFLVDNERGKEVPIQLGTKILVMPESGANGHFQTIIKRPAAEVLKLAKAQQSQDGWLGFQAITRPGDKRKFTGAVQLIDQTGASVISDIDDTIKISEVKNKPELLANTFLRDYRAVPGMAKLYQQWQKKQIAFHYVSGSPWQLYVPLSQFMAKSKFPAGSFHLKSFRWKDSTFLNLFASQEAYKMAAIEPILKAFPQRKFICVGDSGEKDPEVYGKLAQKYPKQIVRILIRDVTGEKSDSDRYQNAFKGLPKDSWQVFVHAKEIRSGQ